MKYRITDPRTSEDIMGGIVERGNPILMLSVPTDEQTPYYRDLAVGKSGMYQFRACGCKDIAQITRIE